MNEEQHLGTHEILLKSSVITDPVGSAHSSSTGFAFRGGIYGWPSGATYAGEVYSGSLQNSFDNPAGSRSSNGAVTVWKDVDIGQFIPHPFRKFDYYNLSISTINVEVYGDANGQVNPAFGTVFEYYLDSPGFTKSVVYHSGDAYQAPSVTRGALMTYLVAIGTAYSEYTSAGVNFPSRIKPVLQLRVPASQLKIDIKTTIAPTMNNNPPNTAPPLNPAWGAGIEIGPQFVLMSVTVTGVRINS